MARSSDSPESAAFPSFDSGWIDRPLRRAYSSGYCCRFPRHSLFQSGCKGTNIFLVRYHISDNYFSDKKYRFLCTDKHSIPCQRLTISKQTALFAKCRCRLTATGCWRFSRRRTFSLSENYRKEKTFPYRPNRHRARAGGDSGRAAAASTASSTWDAQ